MQTCPWFVIILPGNTCPHNLSPHAAILLKRKESTAIIFQVFLTHLLTAFPLNVHWFAQRDCAVFPSLLWCKRTNQPLELNSKPSSLLSLPRAFSSVPTSAWKPLQTFWKSTCMSPTGSTETSWWRSRTFRSLISCRRTLWKSSTRWEFYKVQQRKTRTRGWRMAGGGGNH